MYKEPPPLPIPTSELGLKWTHYGQLDGIECTRIQYEDGTAFISIDNGPWKIPEDMAAFDLYKEMCLRGLARSTTKPLTEVFKKHLFLRRNHIS